MMAAYFLTYWETLTEPFAIMLHERSLSLITSALNIIIIVVEVVSIRPKL